MLFQFLLIILIYQFTGDAVLQFNKIFFKKKIENYTLLEHFLFSLVFGIILNSIFTLIEVYFIPFNLLLLFIINFIFIGIGFFINHRSFQGFFYWRFFMNFQRDDIIPETRDYYLKLLIFLILIIIIDSYFRLFLHTSKRFQDLTLYTHHALDAIRNGWNNYDPNYLGYNFSSKIFTFLLIPFYSMDPNNWLFITDVFLIRLQFYLFFLIVYIIFYKLNSRLNVLMLLIFVSAIYLPTWFSYFLPSNFIIIVFLLLLIYCLDENLRSTFLFIITLTFSALLHITSILIMFGFPLLLTLLIKFYKEPNSLFLYKKFTDKNNRILKILQKYKIFIFFGILLSSIILIKVLSPIIINAWNFYFSLFRFDATPIPTWELWNSYTLGLSIMIPIFILIGLNLRNSKIFNSHKYFLLFFFIFSLYISIILLNYDFWRHIIRSTYLEYRFIIYLDLSIVFLIPYFFYILQYEKKKLQSIENNKYNSHKNLVKKYNIQFQKFKRYINKNYLQLKEKIREKKNYILIYLIIVLICVPKVYNNYKNNYKYRQFSNYWPTSYQNAVNYLKNFDLSNSTYIFNPNAKIFTADWNFFHTYLGDTRCINLDIASPFFNDSLYSTDNVDLKVNYNFFLDFIFNQTKKIYSYAAVYKTLPESLKQTTLVDYIFLDSYSNGYLVSNMINDTRFIQIFEESSRWVGNYYIVYIFETHNS